MFITAIVLLLGSGLVWLLHYDYGLIYEEVKDDYPDLTKLEICHAVCMNDYRVIMILSFIFYLINPLLLLVSIGALITFITVKIPSLERAVNNV